MTTLGLVLLIALIIQLMARELRLVAEERYGQQRLLTAPELATLAAAAVLLGPEAIELLT